MRSNLTIPRQKILSIITTVLDTCLRATVNIVAMTTHYEALEVGQDATLVDIRKQFQTLSLLVHNALLLSPPFDLHTSSLPPLYLHITLLCIHTLKHEANPAICVLPNECM